MCGDDWKFDRASTCSSCEGRARKGMQRGVCRTFIFDVGEKKKPGGRIEPH